MVDRTTDDLPLTQRTEWGATRDALVLAQAAYLAANGEYAQIRRGVARDWQALGITAPTSVAVWVDVYRGPYGQGFTICGEYDDAGTTYRRDDHTGAESWRESAWRMRSGEETA